MWVARWAKHQLLNHLGDGKLWLGRPKEIADLLNHLGDGKPYQDEDGNKFQLLNHLGDGKLFPIFPVKR